MKLLFSFLLLVFLCSNGFSQTLGISYQAVIIDPEKTQSTTGDAQGGVLVNQVVTIQFTVLNEKNEEEFQEIQQISTRNPSTSSPHFFMALSNPKFPQYKRLKENAMHAISTIPIMT